MLEANQSRTKERARRTAQRKADEAKEEFGRLAFETLEEYFPEQARERRSGERLEVLAVGVAAGFVLGYLLGR